MNLIRIQVLVMLYLELHGIFLQNIMTTDTSISRYSHFLVRSTIIQEPPRYEFGISLYQFVEFRELIVNLQNL